MLMIYHSQTFPLTDMLKYPLFLRTNFLEKHDLLLHVEIGLCGNHTFFMAEISAMRSVPQPPPPQTKSRMHEIVVSYQNVIAFQ